MSRNTSFTPRRHLGRVAIVLGVIGTVALADDFAPRADERQLPYAMHSEMSERPTITVGRAGTDLIGADNRALQAAVDYVAGLGGGTVEIGEGEYLMRDSLHLRSNVTVRGRKGKTILRKADASASPLALDGDFGEQQVTVGEPAGFAVGAGRRDLGRQRRGLPHHRGPDHRTPREHLRDRRAADGRLHGRQACEGGHRLPRGRRLGHPGTCVGPDHRGEFGVRSPLDSYHIARSGAP